MEVLSNWWKLFFWNLRKLTVFLSALVLALVVSTRLIMLNSFLNQFVAVILGFGLLASIPSLENCWSSFNFKLRTGIRNSHRDVEMVGTIVARNLGYLLQSFLVSFIVLENTLVVGFPVGDHSSWPGNVEKLQFFWKSSLCTHFNKIFELFPFTIRARWFSPKSCHDLDGAAHFVLGWTDNPKFGVNELFQTFQNCLYYTSYCLATISETITVTNRCFFEFQVEKTGSTQSIWFVVEFLLFKRNQGFYTVSNFLSYLQTCSCTILFGKLSNVVQRICGALIDFAPVTFVAGVQS
jgi:hypothetical protein